jgi:hypothetical protein
VAFEPPFGLSLDAILRRYIDRLELDAPAVDHVKGKIRVARMFVEEVYYVAFAFEFFGAIGLVLVCPVTDEVFHDLDPFGGLSLDPCSATKPRRGLLVILSKQFFEVCGVAFIASLVPRTPVATF